MCTYARDHRSQKLVLAIETHLLKPHGHQHRSNAPLVARWEVLFCLVRQQDKARTDAESSSKTHGQDMQSETDRAGRSDRSTASLLTYHRHACESLGRTHHCFCENDHASSLNEQTWCPIETSGFFSNLTAST